MTTLAQDMGTSGSSAVGPALLTPYFFSGTYTVPADGLLMLRAIGGGGSGAKRGSSATQAATGGYAGGWGAVLLRVKKNDVVTIVIGAGGASIGGTTGSNGIAGTATTLTINGTTYSAPGGPGGVFAASGTPTVPPGVASASPWDISVAPARPGRVAGGVTGGAGLDIKGLGLDATKSADLDGSAGGGSGSPGSQFTGGGALPGGADALGFIAAANAPGNFVGGVDPEWAISFWGGGGGTTTTGNPGQRGGNGGGGTGINANVGNAGSGGNGGGGGSAAATSAQAGPGGIGAGGGAAYQAATGAGGQGYAVIGYIADRGV